MRSNSWRATISSLRWRIKRGCWRRARTRRSPSRRAALGRRHGATRGRNFRLAKSLCWKSCLRGRHPMADKLKAKDKVDHPEAQFDKPKEVVQDKTLSRNEQNKALNTWEQDERQLLTASNEGMPGREEGLQSDDGNRLDEVVRTKEKIGEKPKHKPSH